MLYAIATKTSPGQSVDVKNAAVFVRENYGYTDLPNSVVERILKRNPHDSFEKKNGSYFLKKPLDSYVSEVDRKRTECENYISQIGVDLSCYLQSHCKRNHNCTEKEATVSLQSFFSRYGLFVGTNRLEQQTELSPKDHETDYYIARYIIEKKKDNAKEYMYIIALLKGYFLQTAIYLQPENGNLRTANYSEVEFYYDTPFLLDLLGYQSQEAEIAAKELHNMLKKQKAKCYYFPSTEEEIMSILSAYQHTIQGQWKSWRTLEGLDRKKYSSAGVERLKSSWMRTLEASFGIRQKSTPGYAENAEGNVEEAYILDENEIKECIKEQAQHYSEDNLKRDVESVLAIHRIRVGHSCSEIESSRSVFVTTNVDLAKAFNRYYRSKVNKKAFVPVITASELAAIAWIKGGSIGTIPESQLLINAYSALQPIPELLERFGTVLDQMQEEGKITPDVALALRTSHYVKRELWKNSFGDESSTNENTILAIKEKYDQQLLCDHLSEEEADRKKRQDDLYRRAESQAIDIGREKKEKMLRILRKAFKLVFAVLVIGSLIATISTWGNVQLSATFIVLLVVNSFAFYDVWKAREKTIDAVLVKISNQYETKVVEKKKKEYINVIE